MGNHASHLFRKTRGHPIQNLKDFCVRAGDDLHSNGFVIRVENMLESVGKRSVAHIM